MLGGGRELEASLVTAHCFCVKQEPPGQFGVTKHLPHAGSALSHMPRPQAHKEPSYALTGLLTSRKRT